MNNKARKYVYIVNPGTFAGAGFFATFEMQNLGAAQEIASDNESAQVDVDAKSRNWVNAVIGLPKAAQRLVRDRVWRRAGQPLETAAS